MTLLPRGMTHMTAREQQPPPQLLQQPQQPQQPKIMAHNGNCNRRYNEGKYPRREVGQGSSTADSSKEPGEFSFVIGPKVNMLNELCDSWPNSFRTRSNWVSPRDEKVNTLSSIGGRGVMNHCCYYSNLQLSKQNATGRQPPNAAGPLAHKSLQSHTIGTIQRDSIMFFEKGLIKIKVHDNTSGVRGE